MVSKVKGAIQIQYKAIELLIRSSSSQFEHCSESLI